jgi:hypothetical protein
MPFGREQRISSYPDVTSSLADSKETRFGQLAHPVKHRTFNPLHLGHFKDVRWRRLVLGWLRLSSGTAQCQTKSRRCQGATVGRTDLLGAS